MSRNDHSIILMLMRLYREPEEATFRSTCKDYMNKLIAENIGGRYDDIIEYVDLVMNDRNEVIPM